MRVSFLPDYFCCPLMATYSQTVIFGHLIHRVSFSATFTPSAPNRNLPPQPILQRATSTATPADRSP